MDKLNNLLVDALDIGISLGVALVFFVLAMVLLYLLDKTAGGRNEKNNNKDG